MPKVTDTQDHDDPDYVKERERCDFTASEIPTLFGVGYSGSSIAGLIDVKRGKRKAPIPSVFQREKMERGRMLEAPAARVFEDWCQGLFRFEETGLWVRAKQREDEPLIGATPDRLMVDAMGRRYTLEIKVPDNVADKDEKTYRWCAYRAQLEVQMRCVDNCVGGYLFVYNHEDPENSRAFGPYAPDDILWGLIMQKVEAFRPYLTDLSLEVPRCKRGFKTHAIDEWMQSLVDRENEKHDAVKRNFLSQKRQATDTSQQHVRATESDRDEDQGEEEATDTDGC